MHYQCIEVQGDAHLQYSIFQIQYGARVASLSSHDSSKKVPRLFSLLPHHSFWSTFSLLSTGHHLGDADTENGPQVVSGHHQWRTQWARQRNRTNAYCTASDWSLTYGDIGSRMTCMSVTERLSLALLMSSLKKRRNPTSQSLVHTCYHYVWSHCFALHPLQISCILDPATACICIWT